MSGQSQTLGQRTIQAILNLTEQYKSLITTAASMENSMDDELLNEFDYAEFTIELKDIRTQADGIQRAIQRKRASLGVDEHISLANLQRDKYLQQRMNALALKTRIRDRLRQRKFELERLERAYRHTISGKHLK